MQEVTIYDMGEKVSTILKIPIRMFSQATFPKISREKNIGFINKVMWIAAGIILLLYGISFIFANYIVYILSGEQNEIATYIIRILSFSSVIIVFNYFLGSNRLVPFGYKKIYMQNAIINCIFFLVGFGFLILLKSVSIYSISILYISSEIFILIITLYYSFKYNLLYKQITH